MYIIVFVACLNVNHKEQVELFYLNNRLIFIFPVFGLLVWNVYKKVIEAENNDFILHIQSRNRAESS